MYPLPPLANPKLGHYSRKITAFALVYVPLSGEMGHQTQTAPVNPPDLTPDTATQVRQSTTREERLKQYIRGLLPSHLVADIAVVVTPTVSTAAVSPTNADALTDIDDDSLNDPAAQRLVKQYDEDYLILITSSPADTDNICLSDQLTADAAYQFGLALHETLHILKTSFGPVNSIVKDQVDEQHQDFIHYLINIAEDGAIEHEAKTGDDFSSQAANRLTLLRQIASRKLETIAETDPTYTLGDAILKALYDELIYDTSVTAALVDPADTRIQFKTSRGRSAFINILPDLLAYRDDILALRADHSDELYDDDREASINRAQRTIDFWHTTLQPLIDPDSTPSADHSLPNSHPSSDTEASKPSDGGEAPPNRAPTDGPQKEAPEATDYECPECGDSFGSDHGRRVHYGQQHDDADPIDAQLDDSTADPPTSQPSADKTNDLSLNPESYSDPLQQLGDHPSIADEPDTTEAPDPPPTAPPTPEQNSPAPPENDSKEPHPDSQSTSSSDDSSQDSTPPSPPNSAPQSPETSSLEDEPDTPSNSTPEFQTESSDHDDPSETTPPADTEPSAESTTDSAETQSQDPTDNLSEPEGNSQTTLTDFSNGDDTDSAETPSSQPPTDPSSSGDNSTAPSEGAASGEESAQSGAQQGAQSDPPQPGDHLPSDSTSLSPEDSPPESSSPVDSPASETTNMSHVSPSEDHSPSPPSPTDTPQSERSAKPVHDPTELSPEDFASDRQSAQRTADEQAADTDALNDDLQSLENALGDTKKTAPNEDNGGSEAGPGSVSELTILPDPQSNASSVAWNSIERTADTVADTLAKTLRLDQQTDTRSGLSSGSQVNVKTAYRLNYNDPRTFSRSLPGNEKDYFIVFILDRSGSMRRRHRHQNSDTPSKIDIATQALASFALACERLDIDVAIVDFYNNEARYVKPPSIDTEFTQETLLDPTTGGGTPLKDSLSLARTLADSSAKQSLIISITDDMPDDIASVKTQLSNSHTPVCSLTIAIDCSPDNPPEQAEELKPAYAQTATVFNPKTLNDRIDELASLLGAY